jgi:outer membrane murein-binding lipoprotein Lpp
MRTPIFIFASVLMVSLLAACNQTANTEKPLTAEIDTAVKYHIETAANDLRYAIKDATPENVRYNQQFIEYAQITIPQTIELCRNLGDSVRLAELIRIDAELTRVLKDSTLGGNILIQQVNRAAGDLDQLLKL